MGRHRLLESNRPSDPGVKAAMCVLGVPPPGQPSTPQEGDLLGAPVIRGLDVARQRIPLPLGGARDDAYCDPGRAVAKRQAGAPQCAGTSQEEVPPQSVYQVLPPCRVFNCLHATSGALGALWRRFDTKTDSEHMGRGTRV